MALLGYQHPAPPPSVLDDPGDTILGEAPVIQRCAVRTYIFDSLCWAWLCEGIINLAGATTEADVGIDRWCNRWAS